MKRFTALLAILCATMAWFAASAEELHAATITIESLLTEMTDRDAVARLSEPSYFCKQASSHDRATKTPDDPEGWFANRDYGQFLRTEQNEGRTEWVIMEHDGPGAVTRFWLPLNPSKDDQVIRFYFDGATTPAIAARFNELLSGRRFVKPPLAFVAWNETDLRHQMQAAPPVLRHVGGDLYLPIPFARSCKITLDQVPFYYIIDYRAYAPGTAVRTFTMSDYEAAADTLKRVGEVLTATANLAVTTHAKQAKLAPGEELILDLPDGEAAVRNLQVQIDPKDAPQVLRSAVLRATFDDEPTVWCTLGEFFGAGARLNPVRDWWRAVEKDGTLTARWVMPYRRSAQLAVKNHGAKPMAVKLAPTNGAWNWDDRSLHFHATWRCQYGIKTRPMSDWNYVEIQGRGIYAGDTLTVFSPARQWYGEGDEKVYLDGESFPSHIGTGTEDYYGYAWGMTTFFNSPFISAPHRDYDDRGNWKGYTTTSRVRLLDGIPFRSAFKLDMEIWNWADTQVDYAVGCFWYALPGATSNRGPLPEEAARELAELPAKLKGAIECETMQIIAKTPGVPAEPQDRGLTEGEWSGDAQLFVRGNRIGDFVVLSLPCDNPGAKQLTVYATKSWDYGILRFSVNGQTAGKDYDAWSEKPVTSGPIELGVFEPKDGAFSFRAEVVGANPQSKNSRSFFGLDAVTLTEP